MANEVPLKISGRIRSAEVLTADRNGNPYKKPLGMIKLEQTQVNVVSIIGDEDDIEKAKAGVGQVLEIPVLQSINAEGRYAGQPNYRVNKYPTGK